MSLSISIFWKLFKKTNLQKYDTLIFTLYFIELSYSNKPNQNIACTPLNQFYFCEYKKGKLHWKKKFLKNSLSPLLHTLIVKCPKKNPNLESGHICSSVLKLKIYSNFYVRFEVFWRAIYRLYPRSRLPKPTHIQMCTKSSISLVKYTEIK